MVYGKLRSTVIGSSLLILPSSEALLKRSAGTARSALLAKRSFSGVQGLRAVLL
jgi:hypothetical protein